MAIMKLFGDFIFLFNILLYVHSCSHYMYGTVQFISMSAQWLSPLKVYIGPPSFNHDKVQMVDLWYLH